MWPLHHLVMFSTMCAIQVFVMPYVMTASPAHVYFTVTQAYMGVFMGACMVAVEGALHPMPLWAWGVTVAVAAAAIVAYRWQIGITDRGWLREMIPHHSMAVLTSQGRTRSDNPMVQRLAETILLTQRREIGEMEHILQERSVA